MASRLHRTTFNVHQLADRLLLWMIVCVSVLQLPVPVLHKHEAVQAGYQIHQHVAKFHSASTLPNDDFHWHWMLPSEFGQHEESDDSLASPLRIFLSSALVTLEAERECVPAHALSDDACLQGVIPPSCNFAFSDDQYCSPNSNAASSSPGLPLRKHLLHCVVLC